MLRAKAVARNYVVLLVGHIASRAISLISMALIARQVGAAQTGLFTSALTVALFGSALMNWGSDLLAIRRVARDPTQAEAALRELFATRLCGWSFVGLLSGILFVWIPSAGVLIPPLILALLAYTVRQDWLLLANGQARAIVVAVVARELSYVALLLYMLQASASAHMAAWCFCAAEWIWSAATVIWARGWRQWHWGLPGLRDMAASYRAGLPVAWLALSNLAYNKLDLLLVTACLGASAAGVYAASYSIVFGALGLSSVLSRAAYPELARAGGSASESVLRISRFPAIAGTACSVGMGFWALPVMTLVFGREFQGGARVLEILCWSLGPAFATGLLTHSLIANGDQGRVSRIVTCGIAVGVGLNLLLLPSVGIIGAAAATVIAELTVLGLTAAAFKECPALADFVLAQGWILLAGVLARFGMPMVVSATPPALGVIGVGVFLLLCLPIALDGALVNRRIAGIEAAK